MIGVSYTNARPSIAALFGVMPMLGTNPIAFGAPSDMEYPFLYDAATSISQRGKIEVLGRANKPTPEGWAIDQKGQICTDTKKLLVDLVNKDAAMVGLGGLEEHTGGHNTCCQHTSSKRHTSYRNGSTCHRRNRHHCR
jgi:LDH2 family malate/lactate/ureidoglycolate dehydrogenase